MKTCPGFKGDNEVYGKGIIDAYIYSCTLRLAYPKSKFLDLADDFRDTVGYFRVMAQVIDCKSITIYMRVDQISAGGAGLYDVLSG